jgi:hypothetical protein
MNALLIIAITLVAIFALVAFVASRPRGHQLTPLANSITSGTHSGDMQIVLEEAVARRHLMLKKGAADNGALICTAADKPMCLAEDQGAIADNIAMHRLGMGGRTALGVASGAIAANARLSPAAGGKIRTLPAGAGTYWVCGEAIEAAADDEEFEGIFCAPYQVTIP